MKIHPYAIIIGIVIGFVMLGILRHIFFAIFAGIIAVILIDMAYKSAARRKDEDETS